MNEFTDHTTIISVLSVAISFLINLSLSVICFIYYLRTKRLGALFMLIGLLLMLLQTVANPMIMAYIASLGSQQLANYVLVNSLLGLFPYLIFAIGLGILLVRNFKKT